MGNGVTKLSTCFTGRERFRQKDITFQLPDPLDEGLGHSFCYVRPDQTLTTSSKVHSELEETTTTVFRTISGASVSANTATPLSTSLYDPYGHVDRAAAFESTTSFPSIPLQPIPRSSGDDPIERGFLSGPIERGFMSGSLDDDGDGIDNPSSDHHFQRSFSHGLALRVGSKRRSLVRILRGAISKTVSRRQNSVVAPIRTEKNLKEGTSNDDVSVESQSLQWAQGKAGEDRVHVVVSEEHGWLFVGIYDGFNGPDAPDYLLSHLYPTLHRELKDLLLWNGPHNHCERRWRCEWDQEKQDLDRRLKEQIKHRTGSGSDRLTDHNEVLHALSEALRKTEEAYLDTADKMLEENPELALMGSCVLVMLMKGEDVYVMNVGDSRAVLGQRLERINEETMIKGCEGDPGLSASQLTVDHSTNVEEEIERIRNEHPDDASAVTNERVKGSLKVTRAFGAGFLKQPKWNNALLEMFQIDYKGESPYINCLPSLYHHRLGSKDQFLILSSDGLYQYFTNEEAVSEVELFITLQPEGDPAQHLVQELLFRAAKKAGIDFHELLEIPQGERRRYHDDVSIVVISLEGRMWRSCV
ncbi:hypothetical protein HID58_079276 [Brassica napus]|uniref:protein-serine/threonine phosphatase n=3 Tax=Brassica TaxID=3705 RepID=A0A078J496_BRANA|nr:PREDICTED: probable protein phosphatase 2C 4 isoform X1 [Brassica oleracea var. oleracea]XP_048621608.1 probable protein phosphatase 2C 4 [Brassica napus]KAH0862065.1 hypothetical protein HID58_079276 [Brassica napus]CAF2105689.1 unnamed protein product [Brassica napus]CDY57256.1 BnaC08g47600D [Brassica napus]